jgi:hypothetical protein
LQRRRRGRGQETHDEGAGRREAGAGSEELVASGRAGETLKLAADGREAEEGGSTFGKLAQTRMQEDSLVVIAVAVASGVRCESLRTPPSDARRPQGE